MASQPHEQRACPQCGRSASRGAVFCGSCGYKLSPSVSSQDAQASATVSARRRLRELRPAFGLWLTLLGLGAVVGIAGWRFDTDSPWFDVGFSILAIAVVADYARREHDRLAALLRWTVISIRGWGVALGGFAVLAAFMWLYLGGLSWVGLPSVSYLDPFREHGWPLWTALVLVSVIPGILEEIAFRGIIMGRLEQAMQPGEALVVQAAMFSVLHFSVFIFPSHFACGLILGVVKQRSRSLLPGMLVHGAWNAFVLAIEWVGPSRPP